MSFLNNMLGKFAGENQGEGYGQQQPQYGNQRPYGDQGPPQVPYPWVAEWDQRDGRWIFINRETGERTFNHPQQGYGGGYGGQQYGGQEQYGGQQGYGGGGYEQRGEYYQDQQQKPSHTGRNVALGAVAGLAGGALLMHEGEKVEEHWDEDKYRMDQEGNRIEGDIAPEDAAQWAGRRVQDVEDIPQDVGQWKDREEYRAEQRFDDGVQDVEDAPEDIARWGGRKVQDVEDIPQDIEGRFDSDVDRVEGRFDNVNDAYDEGRDEGRDDDRW